MTARAARRSARFASLPEGEREEIRQIFAAKGFEGHDLERVVEVITSDAELWTETMMIEELGYGSTEPNEYRAALATLAAFLTVGFLPLLVFVYDLAAPGDVDNAFTWSAVMTGIAFLVVGGMKSRFVDQSWWRSDLETLLVGGLSCGARVCRRRAAPRRGMSRPWSLHCSLASPSPARW